ncbi:DUF4870 domain-containing protein [Paenibacillus sp. Aloe-11]|uniref:DUF4870 domain-containing protein n=1 Tax=Paenibacillus sp. Aloe-11 TaxID=1050222 RepID=UPI00024F07F9|nr:DUF4870 domain-containing protein [Paenibacillus sp. Aloe-11]EHS56182.1 hypothetical protein WG8_3803 [Paenibacillus sp. Aloe-11]
MKDLLSSLCYFSIFFAPFLLPIIVWIAVRDEYVRGHAKKAILSHIFPIIAAIPLFYFIVTANHAGSVVGFVLLFVVVYLGVFVYNIYKGIMTLREAA